VRETPNAVEFAKESYRKAGPVTRQEKILLAVFVAVVLLWITGGWHGMDATVIALLGISALLLTRVLVWSDIVNETHAWTSLFGMADL
jgi:DASS family divalent anion:Na+ symporter